ncbi:hypothetical protein COJ16_27095 [Bacillus cereus]|nr:hypothetical protein COJ16_27095 [Bacillus cereus]
MIYILLIYRKSFFIFIFLILDLVIISEQVPVNINKMTFNDMLFLKIILPNISPTLNIIITIKI